MIREWNEESLDHRNALLYAMGISEEDAKRPVIGLVNSWNEMNPGHFPFDKTVIQEMKDEIYKAGGLALELPVTGICDGICSNTPGDRYTLPARDLVSSEVEMVAELNMFFQSEFFEEHQFVLVGFEPFQLQCLPVVIWQQAAMRTVC